MDFVLSKTSISRRSRPGSAAPFKDSRPDTLAFMLSTLNTKVWLELVKGYAIFAPTMKTLGAMLRAITAARFAAILLGVLAAALSAQNTPTGQVIITVVDQSGAVIPGASIGMIQLPVAYPPIPNNFDWVQYALHA
jgi:hypothetical protein